GATAHRAAWLLSRVSRVRSSPPLPIRFQLLKAYVLTCSYTAAPQEPFGPCLSVLCLFGFPCDVALSPGPSKMGDAAAGGSSDQVSLLEVDPAVAPGEAGLVRRVAEGFPMKRHIAGRDGSGLEL